MKIFAHLLSISIADFSEEKEQTLQLQTLNTKKGFSIMRLENFQARSIFPDHDLY